jgi:hypothetical protein
VDNWENGIKVDDDITAKHQLEYFMDVFVDHFEEKKEKFEKLSSVPSSANNWKKLTKQWKTVVDRFSQIKISLENAVEMECNNCEQLSMEQVRHSSSSLSPNDYLSDDENWPPKVPHIVDAAEAEFADEAGVAAEAEVAAEEVVIEGTIISDDLMNCGTIW